MGVGCMQLLDAALQERALNYSSSSSPNTPALNISSIGPIPASFSGGGQMIRDMS